MWPDLTKFRPCGKISKVCIHFCASLCTFCQNKEPTLDQLWANFIAINGQILNKSNCQTYCHTVVVVKLTRSKLCLLFLDFKSSFLLLSSRSFLWRSIELKWNECKHKSPADDSQCDQDVGLKSSSNFPPKHCPKKQWLFYFKCIVILFSPSKLQIIWATFSRKSALKTFWKNSPNWSDWRILTAHLEEEATNLSLCDQMLK